MRTQAPAGAPGHLAGRGPRPPASRAFDAAAALLATGFGGGLYLDGWAHVHGHVDQSFFTPWHAVLYSGYLALALLLGVTARRNHVGGTPWRESVPPGYELSLLGAGVFLVGGAADLVWHMVFGIEANVDALYSPTHLILATAGVLMASGPLRSALRRTLPAGADRRLPWTGLASLLIVLSVLTFFTQPAHPLVDPQAAGRAPLDFGGLVFYQQALGVAAVILQSAILMGLVLVVLRRRTLPAGFFTALLGANAFALSFLGNRITGHAGGLRLVPTAILAGVLSDVLYAALASGRLGARAMGRATAVRLLASGVPVIFYQLYFLALIATTGIWWSVHLWVGSVAIAGLTGLLLSYVAVPPTGPPMGPPTAPDGEESTSLSA